MHQGARYIDEARRDVTTQRRNDATTRRLDDDEMQNNKRRNDVARRRDGTGRDNKGQRDNATANQMNKRTDEHTNKAGAR